MNVNSVGGSIRGANNPGQAAEDNLGRALFDQTGLGNHLQSFMSIRSVSIIHQLARDIKFEARDRADVLAAVRQNGLLLQHASDALRGDRDVVMAALCQNINAKRWAALPAGDLQGLIRSIEAVKQDGCALQYESRALVLEVVRQDGDALRYASEELLGDREVVLTAVRQNGGALRYASAELKGDREVVLEAVRQNGLALGYASDNLKGDRDVVLEAVRQDWCAVQYASRELCGDRGVVLEAVRQYGCALLYASAELKGDRDVVLAAVRQDERALYYASAELKRDPEVVQAARGRQFVPPPRI
jgi:hypothetical protein